MDDDYDGVLLQVHMLQHLELLRLRGITMHHNNGLRKKVNDECNIQFNFS